MLNAVEYSLEAKGYLKEVYDMDKAADTVNLSSFNEKTSAQFTLDELSLEEIRIGKEVKLRTVYGSTILTFNGVLSFSL